MYSLVFSIHILRDQITAGEFGVLAFLVRAKR